MLSPNALYRLSRFANGSPRAYLASALMRRLEASGLIKSVGGTYPGTDLIQYRITEVGLAELNGGQHVRLPDRGGAFMARQPVAMHPRH